MIAPWCTEYPGRIFGSVYAAPPPQRTAFARALAAHGLGVHIDVMADREGLPAGVSLRELHAISARPGPVDVHLIGSAAFADDVLSDVLRARPAKVILPWEAFDRARADTIRSAGAQAWIAVWREWAADGAAPPWPAQPDGALVMLIEPGTRDLCQPDRLGIAAACAAHVPVIVDGGVTEDLAPLCVTAGVDMVVGRALLADPPKKDLTERT
ncbi:ribulose phosphate epimerase [Mycolicibacterium goodii]|uniref:ribulose phosphate epimerase n=1 Tax=Mycolicibacterium goodii TaxID=134601 RepID=UPI001BDDB7A9|nr:ribulose phosphate epimerase [Mycolicibacterium goodii]MBU8818929.1 ribulose phosphate epimerase [Mycolicibacterium goodii]